MNFREFSGLIESTELIVGLIEVVGVIISKGLTATGFYFQSGLGLVENFIGKNLHYLRHPRLLQK